MRFVFAFACAVIGFAAAGCPQGTHGHATQCTLSDGSKIDVGNSGSAGDACNTCVCNADVTLDCTERDCSDAGPHFVDAGPVADGGVEDAGTADAGVDEGPCHDHDHDGFYSCIDPD